MDTTAFVNKLAEVIINPLLILIFSIALVVFVWGLAQYLYQLNVGGKDSKTGRDHMIWGLVGMFIMAAAGGILNLIENTLNTIR